MKLSRLIFLASLAFSGTSGAVCQEPSAPEKNFEALWETFNNRYAFFELRGVDWRSQYDTFRPRVTEDTTDEELFIILSDMLRPLKDAHVNLKTKGQDKQSFSPEQTPRFLKEFDSKKLRKQFAALVEKTLADNGFDQIEKANQILSYSRSDEFGYLLIHEFEGVSSKQLEKDLDKVFRDMAPADSTEKASSAKTGRAGIEGLIVDIRLNPGGTDKCAYQIMRRFADKARVGHHKKTRIGPGRNDFGKLKTHRLEPATDATPNSKFTGPIALLTHGASYSAADVFAMVMADLPHVTIIGEPTHGIFSDMLERKLPNGWKYSLSHQVYLSADNTCYEGKGVPVDIEVLNKRTDLEAGADPLISKSLKVLSDKASRVQSLKLK